MECGNDIAGLIEINKLLHNYITLAIIERGDFTNDSFISMLSIQNIVIEDNNNKLTGLIGGNELCGGFAGKAFLNEWMNDALVLDYTKYPPEALKVENWIVIVLEAYNKVLNTTSLTSCINKSILMDQKFFLQRFLIDLIKFREFYSESADLAITV